jgi:curved DNA-binding protein CbpA
VVGTGKTASNWLSGNGLLAALYDSHVHARTGALRVRKGVKEARVFMRKGQVVYVTGIDDLMFDLYDRLSGVSDWNGDLESDIECAMRAGMDMPEGVLAAEKGLARYLVRCSDSAGVRWRFDEGEPDIPMVFQFNEPLLNMLALSLESERRIEHVIDAYRGRMSCLSKVTELGRVCPVGLSDISMTALRYAERGQSLGRMIEHLKLSRKGTENDIWRAVDLMVQAGLFELSVPSQRAELDDTKMADAPVVPDEVEDEVAMVKRLNAFAAELLTLHPIAALGLDPDETESEITTDAVRRAFRELASRYHPDRVGSASPMVREAAGEVFSVLNDIRDQVEDPGDLARALMEIRQKRVKGTTISEIDRQRARVLARLAESRMRTSNWKAARDLWVQAREMIADEPFYGLQETFCRAVLKEIPYDIAGASMADVKLQSDTSKEHTTASERLRREADRRFRVGWLYKLAGQKSTALSWFQKTVEIAPEHTEAQRELRLKEMRERASEEAGTSKRGLGALFGWGKRKGD